jgi:hypothetical protein
MPVAHEHKAMNLILPIKPGLGPSLRAILTGEAAGQKGNDDKKRGADDHQAGGNGLVQAALRDLGNVHFAQFVFLDNDTRLAVLTIFDGGFDEYIQSFVERIGPIFNAILAHIDGGDAVIPVEMHSDEFLAFIQAHHEEGLGVFSAYPGKRVFDINS